MSDHEVTRDDLLAVVLGLFMLRLATRFWAMLPPANLPSTLLVVGTIGVGLAGFAIADSDTESSVYHVFLGGAAASAVVAGVLLLMLVKGWLLIPTQVGTAVVVFGGFGLAVAAGLVGVYEPVNASDYLPSLGWFSAGVVVLGPLVLWATVERPYVGTDVMLFTQGAAEHMLVGTNPYTVDLRPTLASVGIDLEGTALTSRVTPRTDGKTAKAMVYPAGAFLLVVPQLLLDIGGPQPLLSFLLPALGIVVLLARVSPPVLVPMGVIAAIGSRNLPVMALGGISDPTWVLPVLVAMVYWYDERFVWAGVWWGLACSMKQQPWIMAPFLGWWLLVDDVGVSEGRLQNLASRGNRATHFFGPAVATFAAVNLPFILWGPRAWALGVVRPLRDGAAPLITQGAGVALLTANGAVPLPKSTYVVILVAWGALLGVIYILFWERIRWTAWLAPGVVLFGSYRSLPTYFLMLVPICYLALLCRTGNVHRRADLWAPRSWVPRIRPGGKDESAA